MSSDMNTPDARLVLPEGYVAEQDEDGRLRIYDTQTGGWLGEITSHLDNAQEVARELIASHEDEKDRFDAAVVLDLGTVAEEEFTERKDKSATELHEEQLGQLAGDNPRAAALRIRELEIVADLAADSLKAAGDEATSEIVRAVLEKRTERQ